MRVRERASSLAAARHVRKDALGVDGTAARAHAGSDLAVGVVPAGAFGEWLVAATVIVRGRTLEDLPVAHAVLAAQARGAARVLAVGAEHAGQAGRGVGTDLARCIGRLARAREGHAHAL